MKVEANVNARFVIDSKHFGEIFKGLGTMDTRKIMAIGISVVLSLIAYNLPELLTIVLR